MSPAADKESTYYSTKNNNNNNNGVEYGETSSIQRKSNYTSTSFNEIEEVTEEDESMAIWNASASNINERLDLIKEDEISRLCPSEGSRDQETVYVAVGKSETSMKALIWALNSLVNPFTTTLYLIHVFPELKWVPSPLGNGKVPRSQVRKETLDMYLKEETTKRRQLLNKFMDKCNAQRVKVETMLIESDREANAILELISVLNIQKLVLGVSKSNLRKLRSRKGNGIPDQILQKAPEWCDIKYICEGKDAFEDNPQVQTPVQNPNAANENDQITQTPPPNLTSNNVGVESQLTQPQRRDNPSFSYCCFKP